MDCWEQCLNEVRAIVERYAAEGKPFLFFRGEGAPGWELIPSLFRYVPPEKESALYYDFVSNAGPLLADCISSWAHLFEMRHYGIPTRLLDWTQTFGTALFFALRATDGACTIRILDPYTLNEKNARHRGIFTPDIDLNLDYRQAFVTRTVEPNAGAIALYPVRRSPRMIVQQSAFTFHGTDCAPLEEQCPEALHSVVIPEEARVGAHSFLSLAGINDYSLFPDLEGLAKWLRIKYGW